MKPIPVLLFFFFQARLLCAQDNIVFDTIPFDFWGGTFWQYNNTIDQIRNPADETLLAVRRYYPNGGVAEEYLRQSDTCWLFQAFDSLDHTRMLTRGLYVADPGYQVVDTIESFDPGTFEEIRRLIVSRYSFKTGPWFERDRNGYIWTGVYEDGLREGLWQKRDAYDFTELRGFMYYGGEIAADSTLNWALTTDTARITGLLCEGVVPGRRGGIVTENTPGGLWRLCDVRPDMLGRQSIWKMTHLDFLPGQCNAETWGSYLFRDDRSLSFILPGHHFTFRDEGRWELLDGNKLLLSLQKKGDKRFQ
ncbi:MAG: hypothetical protein EP344_19305, partial [Bacteroidetes bacterium]